jgi:hypothetical protein
MVSFESQQFASKYLLIAGEEVGVTVGVLVGVRVGVLVGDGDGIAGEDVGVGVGGGAVQHSSQFP